MPMFALSRNSSTLDFKFLPSFVGKQVSEIFHESKILEGWDNSQVKLKYTPPFEPFESSGAFSYYSFSPVILFPTS
jgi:hypothetical protein